jgi:protein SCO1/2
MKLTRTQIQVLAFTFVLLLVAGWFAYQTMRGEAELASGPQFGGEFTLTSMAGEAFTQADLLGSPTMMFFGYTYCPDVCPTTLAEATSWREELGLTPEQMKIVFVSVDPARDTPEHLAEYLSAFGDVIGLTGTEAQIDMIKRGYGVFSEISGDTSSGTYLVNHTASVYMLDSGGDFRGTIAYGEARETALQKVERLAAR